MTNVLKSLFIVSTILFLAGCSSTGARLNSAADEFGTPAPILEEQVATADDSVEMQDPDTSAADEFTATEVAYETAEVPGTIIIDTVTFHLYFIEEGGMARRYGVAVGRDGFGWSGQVHVGEIVENPTWTPPAEMIARKPELEKWRDGMPSGPNNPLGVLALLLYENDRDTLYRIHGTNEPDSIGKAASSGCIRMRNEDVLDLSSRIDVGTIVKVLNPNEEVQG